MVSSRWVYPKSFCVFFLFIFESFVDAVIANHRLRSVRVLIDTKTHAPICGLLMFFLFSSSVYYMPFPFVMHKHISCVSTMCGALVLFFLAAEKKEEIIKKKNILWNSKPEHAHIVVMFNATKQWYDSISDGSGWADEIGETDRHEKKQNIYMEKRKKNHIQSECWNIFKREWKFPEIIYVHDIHTNNLFIWVYFLLFFFFILSFFMKWSNGICDAHEFL